MGVEQAIFTACESGITRQSAGFQVYSYSSGMEQILDTTNAAIMFQYEQPNFGLRPVFEKMDEKSYPKKFAYCIVEEQRKLVCFASNTMVPESRYGNYFSHLLATNLQTLLGYPCEYYKSPLFLEGLTKEQRESKKRPEFLYKRTSMELGTEITYETVKQFLSKNNRISKLKKLLSCLLFYEDNVYGTEKKIVIFDKNDGTENRIIYWIAAITMALPRKCALHISFSDYEYEPMTAPYRICGSLKEGTRYDRQILGEAAYVFDFESGNIPALSIESELFDIIELSYRVSRDCILKFNQFMEDYTYEACDLKLLDAYELYKLLTVPEYITKITRQKLHNAFTFVNEYAKEETKQRIINDMVCFVRERKSMESRVIRELLAFFEVQIKEHRIIKERLVLPLLRVLYESLKVLTKEEKNYLSLEKEMVYFFEQIELPLYRYYLGSIPTNEIVLLLKKTSYQWKIDVTITILKNYLIATKPTVTEIAEDNKFNAILVVLLSRSDIKCPAGKLVELSYLLKVFSFNYSYSTYLYLTIQRYFNSKEGTSLQQAVADYHYAKYFYELSEAEQNAVYEFLMMEEELAIVRLFHYEYEKGELFEPWFEHVTTLIERFNIVKGTLLDGLMQEAFQNATARKENRYQAVQLLFHYAFKIGYRDRFINRLVPFLSVSIPIVVAEEEQLSLIKKLYFYQINYNGGIIEKRVALAYRLYELKEFLESNPKKREKIHFTKKVPIPTMDGLETNNYLKRAGTVIGQIIYQNGQVSLLKECYYLSGEKEQQFLLYVYGALLACGRKRREYTMFLTTFAYAVEETKEDSLASLIMSSGVKVKDLNEQIHCNLPHQVMFRKLVDAREGREELIIRRWKKIKAKCLGKPC